MLSVHDVLEIDPDGSPQPDIAVLRFRDDFYSMAHPNGADALLVVEVNDTEPARHIELWSPTLAREPIAIVQRQDTITFENVTIVVDDVFAGIARP